MKNLFAKDTSFSFDDLLLVPQHSFIKSRQEIDISSRIGTVIKQETLGLPIIASPMTTICEEDMHNVFSEYGSFGIIHRYNSIQEQVEILKKCNGKLKSFAVGMSGDYMERATEGVKAGGNVVCIDVAHGHHVLMKDAVLNLRKEFGNEIYIIAGNVADSDGFKFIADLGVSAVRCGVGSGSICATRIETGHGMSLAATLWDISQNKAGHHDCAIIACGGIRNSGDIVKAIALGADSVIVGSFIAGATETPGESFLNEHNVEVKTYAGMASKQAQVDWSGSSRSIEGVSTTVAVKGSVREILDRTQWQIKSGFSYSGARSIRELRKKAKFKKQTKASMIESDTHIYNARGL